MTGLKRGVADRMRRWADRIDYAGAPKAVGWSFTFERGEGIRFRDDGRGCPLWYLSNDQNERAHTEADKPAPRVPWGRLAGSDHRRAVPGPLAKTPRHQR